MKEADVLVIESDKQARLSLGGLLKDLSCRPVLSASLEDALSQVESSGPSTIIADWEALVPAQRTSLAEASLFPRLGAAVARLRAAHAGRLTVPLDRASPALRIIITSDSANPTAHAAAIQAGADAFLRADEVNQEAVLASYLTRFLDATVSVPAGAPSAPGGGRRRSSVDADVSPGGHVTDAFELHDEDLRDPDSGRWDAKRIAALMAVPLKDLTDAVAVKYSTVARTPDSEALQESLAPFANVLAMTRQAVENDDEKLRKWLRRPQRALKGATPLSAMLDAGAAHSVEQWVAQVWLGEPE